MLMMTILGGIPKAFKGILITILACHQNLRSLDALSASWQKAVEEKIELIGKSVSHWKKLLRKSVQTGRLLHFQGCLYFSIR